MNAAWGGIHDYGKIYISLSKHKTIEVFLCGLMYEKGLRYMFVLSAIFIIFQLMLGYYIIYLRQKE